MRALLIATIAALLLAGCSSTEDNPEGDQNASVKVRDGNFNPTTVNIREDSTVEWLNEGSNAHTVTADDGSFDSGDLPSGEDWDWEFDTAGTYAYHCKYHASMKGSITVAAA